MEYRYGIRPLIGGIVFLVAIAALIAVFASSPGGVSAEMTFRPRSYVHHCNSLDPTFNDPTIAGVGHSGEPDFTPNCVENLATSASPDITTVLHLESGDANFSNVTAFVPNSTTIGTGFAAGTKVGGLRSAAHLGILNGPCNQALTVEYNLFVVALPNNANPQLATNIAWPQAEGVANRFSNWAVGLGDGTGLGAFSLIATDGSALRASSVATPIQNYPGYLLNAFDPNFVAGSTPPYANSDAIIPVAVYGGVSNISGQWIPLYIAQFASGALVPLGGVYGGMAAGMGQPSASVLGDPSVLGGAPSIITDFCTPLTITTMLLGDPAGPGVRVTTPASPGTVFALQYVASQRDLDQDGLENALDSCPFVTNAGDPRDPGGIGTYDEDSDGIDDACDPTLTTDTQGICDQDGPGGLPGSENPGDHDGDCFKNRQDICPTVANGTVQSGGPGHTDTEAANVSPPADDGPATDLIGDVCDSEAGVVTVTQNNQSLNISMSDTVANGRYLTATNVIPKCIGGTDADGDGYCTDREGGQDGPGMCGALSGASACPVYHQNWTAAGHPLGLATLDTDGDGWTDVRETYLNNNVLCVLKTNPAAVPSGNVDGGCLATETVPRMDATKGCSQTTGLNNEFPHDNWPIDFNDGGNSNLSDVLTYIPRLSRSVDHMSISVAGAGTDERWDLDQNGRISLTDILAFYVTAPNIGTVCATALPIVVPPFTQQ